MANRGPLRERITVAVIVCGWCRRFIRVDEWRGAKAHDGYWCISHSMCSECETSFGDPPTDDMRIGEEAA